MTTCVKAGTFRNFGVELEVSHGPGYYDIPSHSGFSRKGDCSVRGDGLEFVSPILSGDAGLDAVAALCDYAALKGWSCDRSCGYHLHIDVRDLDNEQRKRIYYAYRVTQDLWHRFVNSNRIEGNCYCLPIKFSAQEIERNDWNDCIYDAENQDGRYTWCNIVAFENHGTIEIRLHHGTVNRAVVLNWIVAHLRFVEVVRSLTCQQIYAAFNGKTPADMMRQLERFWGDADLSRFYQGRVRRYARRRQPAHA